MYFMILLKRISIIFFTLVLMLGVTGCMENENNKINNKTSRTQVIDGIVSYMEDKYDDTFEYVNSFDGGFDTNQIAIILSSEKLVDKKIHVVYENVDGMAIYEDNYTQLKYEAQTYDLIKELLTQTINKEILLTHRVLRSKNNYSSHTTFEDFLKSSSSNVGFYAIVSPDYVLNDMLTLEEEVKKVFKENFSSCSVNIYFARTEDEYLLFNDIPLWKLEEMKRIVFQIGE